MPKKGLKTPLGKLPSVLLAIAFFVAAIAYLFWTIDFIPDTIAPVIGFLDDAVIFIVGGFIIRGAIKDTIKWLKAMKIL